MNTNNLFQDIQQKRTNFKKYAEKALENNWIAKEQFDDILHKIENDKLVIGVIGQMKAGKSTFLNALIFKDEILPAATTPMTASLSVITYGAEKKLEAEFYTSQEWAELKQFASLDPNDYEGDNNQQSKIKAAKEIVQKSVKIENELPVLLGSKKADAFENLIEYVGADGKYIAITKSVRIEYPLDYLKGVEIVDTPGFNDPVVSREERTKEFLSRADVVIMLLYAGRAFDATDNDIIFNKVRSIGVGKLLIGVNKYDINYLNGESNEMQIANVKEQLLKASEEHSNNSIASLIKEQDPLLISASMALMSQLDLSKINSSENLKFHYDKLISEFEISTQAEMYQKSLMPAFEDAIRNIIFNSKEEILIKKPLNLIKQVGENKSSELEKEKSLTENELVILSKPDTELEDLLANTKRAEKKINRKIKGLEIEVIEKIKKSLKKLTNETEDSIVKSKKKCKALVEDNFVVVDTEKLHNEVIDKIEDLERDIKRIFGRSNDEINGSINNLVNSFISDIDEIAEDYFEDFDYNDYITQIKKHFLEDIVNIQFYDLFEEREEYSYSPDFLDKAFGFVDKLTLGVIGGYFKVLDNIAIGKREEKDWIDNFFSLIDLERIKKHVADSGNVLIENIKSDIIKDFVQPIIEKIEQLIADKSNKENNIFKLESKLKIIKENLNNHKTQVEEMKILETTI